jgi:hypothetical protein
MKQSVSRYISEKQEDIKAIKDLEKRRMHQLAE